MADSLDSATPDPTGSACLACEARRGFLRDGAGFLAGLAGLTTLAPLVPLHALAPRATGGSVRYAIPAASGVSIDRKHEVIVCRAGNEVYAFALACPHQSTELRAMRDAQGFQCPRHKSRYKPDGTFISGRATRNMDRLPITRDGDAIVVDPDVAIRSDKEPARWAEARVTL
jgi:nitrite reductase/ring-hydroxylating ferredoxin subunit